MGSDVAVDTDGEQAKPSKADRRRAAIQRAALEQFSARGLAATSMAQIAEAAGVSRPALYQYFSDKDEIFANAFVGLFEELVDAALTELDGSGSTGDKLDGFLQRFEGDLWERMSASVHTDEMVAAKNAQVAAAVQVVVARLTVGLETYLATLVPGRGAAVAARRTRWTELLRLAPKGLRADEPSIETFRLRLTTLAAAVEADIDAAR